MSAHIITLPDLLRCPRAALERLALSLRIVPDGLGDVSLARVVMAAVREDRDAAKRNAHA